MLLWILAFVFIVFWLLGMVTAHTMGGFIHALLVVAAVTILIRVISGKQVM